MCKKTYGFFAHKKVISYFSDRFLIWSCRERRKWFSSPAKAGRKCMLEIQIWFDGEGRTPVQVDQAMRQLVYEMDRSAAISRN